MYGLCAVLFILEKHINKNILKEVLEIRLLIQYIIHTL